MTNLTDVFRYLDDLRESGDTNMFGAGHYLEDEFGLSRRNARDYLTKWMKSFDPEVDPEIRAGQHCKCPAPPEPYDVNCPIHGE